MDDYVCFCLWDALEQELSQFCDGCKERGASQKAPWDDTWPIATQSTPINHINDGSQDDGSLPRRRCAEHNEFSCVPCLRAAAAQHARINNVLERSLNSQKSALYQNGRLQRATEPYRKARLWTQIPQDANHAEGCALVCAGLLPIIGAFFYECNVRAILVNGQRSEDVTKLGKDFGAKSLLKKYQTEMEDNTQYAVRVSRFSQPVDLHRRLTSRQFDYISLKEMPFMSVAVRHLLLYLGSGRDQDSSYRIYHNTITHGEGQDVPRKYQVLFGIVRFPWSPEPRTATSARMINLMPNDTVPAPALDKGPASWRRFCNSPLKDSWEEIRMRDFRYETYEVEEQWRFRPRIPSPSHTPPGSPPARSPRPSVPPASTPPAAAEIQGEISTKVTGPAPHGATPGSRDQANGNSAQGQGNTSGTAYR